MLSPIRSPLFLLSGIAALVAGAPCVLARDMLPGPVEAEVVRVIDGDTFVATAHIWPGQTITVSVRIRGVDAPEVKSRCAAEKAAAQMSRAALEALIGGGTVKIRNISGDKYFGRVLADVTTAEEEPVAESLLARGLARPYDGGQRVSYCR